MKLIKMNKKRIKKTLRSAAVCCAAAAMSIVPASAFASSGTGTDAASASGGIYGSLDKHHWYNICSTYHNRYPGSCRPMHPSTGSDSDTGNSGSENDNITSTHQRADHLTARQTTVRHHPRRQATLQKFLTS